MNLKLEFKKAGHDATTTTGRVSRNRNKTSVLLERNLQNLPRLSIMTRLNLMPRLSLMSRIYCGMTITDNGRSFVIKIVSVLKVIWENLVTKIWKSTSTSLLYSTQAAYKNNNVRHNPKSHRLLNLIADPVKKSERSGRGSMRKNLD